ncbi:uncharacterized protein LOC133659110 [Entelurus aequoreus]|uniref:uncharacterized protein LOC133659110 n=1 Tax=Entelurus aequoreus TaxID=161455 RepID=UPI002B1DE03C|nr:uncharacterized protein LOC133659110 [Entelurus aequoreus]
MPRFSPPDPQPPRRHFCHVSGQLDGPSLAGPCDAQDFGGPHHSGIPFVSLLNTVLSRHSFEATEVTHAHWASKAQIEAKQCHKKRTYPSGAEKRKKKKVEEEKKCHDKGALLKYFGGTESAQSQSTSSGSTVSDESGPSPSSTVLSHTPPSSVPTVPSMSETTADSSTTSTTTSPSHHGPSSAPPVDPAEWPSFLSDSDRTEQTGSLSREW